MSVRKEQALELPWGELWRDRYKTGETMWMLQTIFSDVPVCIDAAYARAIWEGHHAYLARLGKATADSSWDANLPAFN